MAVALLECSIDEQCPYVVEKSQNPIINLFSF